jgi:hypothetical protein
MVSALYTIYTSSCYLCISAEATSYRNGEVTTMVPTSQYAPRLTGEAEITELTSKGFVAREMLTKMKVLYAVVQFI